MFSQISKTILSLLGWKFIGDYPHEIDKKMIIVVPHTSNWDFPLGLLIRSALKAKIHFIGKASLFKPPHGFIFKALGGFPVKRGKNYNQVDQIVNYYNSRDTFSLSIAPEGTRKKVDKLKTGFYHIALQAKIPVIMMKFDAEHKEVVIKEPFYPTGDKEKDLNVVNTFFRGTKGINPENSFL